MTFAIRGPQGSLTMMMSKWAFILTVAAAIATGGATSASAITFQLTGDHCTGGCGTPPFGTVDVTQNGANVNITVTLAAGFQYAQTGAADGQIFKFNGTDVALTGIVVGAHVPALVAATGAFNGDGTGDFSFGINCPTCGNGPTGFGGAVSFTVNNATIADVTAGNNLGNIFVADVLAPNGNTGPVDVSAVPGPLAGAGLPGLVMACGGLIGLARRRRQKIA